MNQGGRASAGADMDQQQRRLSKMRSNLQQSMYRQMLEEGGEEMAAALAGDIERMTKQMENLSHNYTNKKAKQVQHQEVSARADSSARRASSRLKEDTSGLYQRSASAMGEEPPKRKPQMRPKSLPELDEKKPGVSAATVRRQARRAARPSKQEKQAAEKKKREEVVAKRLAANQPQKKIQALPARKKPRALVVPPACEAEDGLIMRNVREQWKNIGYAIKGLDVNSHMHMDNVAQFGGRTSLLFPDQIRGCLA